MKKSKLVLSLATAYVCFAPLLFGGCGFVDDGTPAAADTQTTSTASTTPELAATATMSSASPFNEPARQSTAEDSAPATAGSSPTGTIVASATDPLPADATATDGSTATAADVGVTRARSPSFTSASAASASTSTAKAGTGAGATASAPSTSTPTASSGTTTTTTTTTTTPPTTTPATPTVTTPTTPVNTASTTTPAPALVPVVSGGYALTDAAAARLYGPGLYTMDSLGNHIAGVVGGYTYVTSQRFRAPVSGAMNSIRPYWAAGPGYAAGNGGTIRIRLVPNDPTTNLPNLSATPLATTNYSPALSNGQLSATAFDERVTFPTPANLVAGTLYHLVFDNVDASPANNFVSLNYMAVVPQNGRNSRWISGLDWGALVATRPVGSSGAFTWRDQGVNGHASNGSFYAPILQVGLSDGRSFGFTDMETGNVEAGRQWDATAAAPVRERFTPTSTRKIGAVSFATATTTGGSLKWELLDGSTVLASGTVTEASANYSTSYALGHATGVFKWYDATLPATLSLAAGKAYDLRFTPQGGSNWRFADERNGGSYRYNRAGGMDRVAGAGLHQRRVAERQSLGSQPVNGRFELEGDAAPCALTRTQAFARPTSCAERPPRSHASTRSRQQVQSLSFRLVGSRWRAGFF